MGALLAARETEGLCSTCNNSPSCFHRARRGPALFCEMFDDCLDLRAGGQQPSRYVADVLVTQEGNANVVGLCANCANRETCKHQLPAGGLWHCEDYE